MSVDDSTPVESETRLAAEEVAYLIIIIISGSALGLFPPGTMGLVTLCVHSNVRNKGRMCCMYMHQSV